MQLSRQEIRTSNLYELTPIPTRRSSKKITESAEATQGKNEESSFQEVVVHVPAMFITLDEDEHATNYDVKEAVDDSTGQKVKDQNLVPTFIDNDASPAHIYELTPFASHKNSSVEDEENPETSTDLSSETPDRGVNDLMSAKPQRVMIFIEISLAKKKLKQPSLDDIDNGNENPHEADELNNSDSERGSASNAPLQNTKSSAYVKLTKNWGKPDGKPELSDTSDTDKDFSSPSKNQGDSVSRHEAVLPIAEKDDQLPNNSHDEEKQDHESKDTWADIRLASGNDSVAIDNPQLATEKKKEKKKSSLSSWLSKFRKKSKKEKYNIDLIESASTHSSNPDVKLDLGPNYPKPSTRMELDDKMNDSIATIPSKSPPDNDNKSSCASERDSPSLQPDSEMLCSEENPQEESPTSSATKDEDNNTMDSSTYVDMKSIEVQPRSKKRPKRVKRSQSINPVPFSRKRHNAGDRQSPHESSSTTSSSSSSSSDENEKVNLVDPLYENVEVIKTGAGAIQDDRKSDESSKGSENNEESDHSTLESKFEKSSATASQVVDGQLINNTKINKSESRKNLDVSFKKDDNCPAPTEATGKKTSPRWSVLLKDTSNWTFTSVMVEGEEEEQTNYLTEARKSIYSPDIDITGSIQSSDSKKDHDRVISRPGNDDTLVVQKNTIQIPGLETDSKRCSLYMTLDEQ
ncbi:unnamed protein product [Clavelina lepadiformis]|uniref:Uncharacterized protein n=1 Tax=Clavelina lepadiformis TaxID=159417 RepID=A0ABP0GS88_CLALP